MANVLEKESEFFREIKEELLKHHRDKFVLVHGREFVGAFDTVENAYNRGVALFERGIFLIKQVTENEPRLFRM